MVDCGSGCGDCGNYSLDYSSQAEKIKKVVDIPVIGVGGIKDPEYANKVINEERVDLVAIGRELLNDRSWASQAIKKLKPNS